MIYDKHNIHWLRASQLKDKLEMFSQMNKDVRQPRRYAALQQEHNETLLKAIAEDLMCADLTLSNEKALELAKMQVKMGVL